MKRFYAGIFGGVPLVALLTMALLFGFSCGGDDGDGDGNGNGGPVGPGDSVAVLEDTTTTGGALLEALDVAVASGLQVVQAVALVDRSGGAVGRRVAPTGVRYQALFAPEDLGVEG